MISNNDTKSSIYEYLLASLDLTSDAIYFSDSIILGKELFKNINSLANYINSFKFSEETVVSLCLPNILESVYAFYAINKAGLIVNIIHDAIPLSGIIDVLEKTRTKLIFTTPHVAKGLIKLGVNENIKIIICGLNSLGLKCKNTYDFNDCKSEIDMSHACNCNPYKTALILNSGGTSGVPKLVELSSYAVNELASKIAKRISHHQTYSKNDNALVVLPLFHGYGLVIGMHSFLALNGTITLIENKEIDYIVSQMNKYKTNIILAVPNMISKFFDNNLFNSSVVKQIKKCYVGGDVLNINLRKKFNELLKEKSSVEKVYEGYGLTELVTVTSASDEMGKEGSVGRPLEGVKYKIVDDFGKILGPFECGELHISGSTIMNGYFEDQEETSKVIYADNEGIKWVKTGDIFYLDEDGYAYFVERKKNVVKISGVNVFIHEIENLAREHANVKDAAVVAQNDKKGKLCLKLFLVLEEPQVIDKIKIQEEVFSILSNKLSKYSLPKEIEIIKELPLTNIGKIDYKKLVEQ